MVIRSRKTGAGRATRKTGAGRATRKAGAGRATRKAGAASSQPWGKHLVLNAAGCDGTAMRSSSTIAAFSRALVKEIDMVAYGAPRIVRFGDHHTGGYTLVQLIQTSSITAHFVDSAGEVYLDVFSCKDFDPATAVAVFRRFFKPTHVKTKFFSRQA